MNLESGHEKCHGCDSGGNCAGGGFPGHERPRSTRDIRVSSSEASDVYKRKAFSMQFGNSHPMCATPSLQINHFSQLSYAKQSLTIS